MLHTMKRGLLVGSVVAVVAALLSGSAMAARGHGHAQFGVRSVHEFGPGGQGGVMFGPGFGGPAFGGPAFGGPGFGPGFGGPGMRGHGPGGPGGPGGGLLAGAVLKTSASYLQMTPADLAAALKGGKTLAQV